MTTIYRKDDLPPEVVSVLRSRLGATQSADWPGGYPLRAALQLVLDDATEEQADIIDAALKELGYAVLERWPDD